VKFILLFSLKKIKKEFSQAMLTLRGGVLPMVRLFAMTELLTFEKFSIKRGEGILKHLRKRKAEIKQKHGLLRRFKRERWGESMVIEVS